MVTLLDEATCLSSNLFLRFEHRDTRLDDICSTLLKTQIALVNPQPL